MAVLRETARHVTRGLDVVGPQCVQARIPRRAQSSAAEADLDEFRAGIHNDRGFDDSIDESGGQCAAHAVSREAAVAILKIYSVSSVFF